MFVAEYFAPKGISEALVLLGKWKRRAKLIAGGTIVVPDIRSNLIQPGALVDISHLKALSYAKEEGKRIRIGGLTTISELESSRIIRKYVPVVSDAARQLGNPLVRNRATIGGNVADASPAADTVVPLLVLGATLIAERKGAKPRQIPIDQFFMGPNQTVLRSGEIIREITFPRPIEGAKMAYLKLGLRNAMAISVVSVGVLVEVEKGKCSKARIALGAVAPTPRRACGVERLLEGQAVTEELIDQCCEAIQDEIQPITDVRATAEYRRSMASVLLKRLLQQVYS